MDNVSFSVKFQFGVVTVTGPNGYKIDLYPGSEAHLKFTGYEKEKKK